MRNEKPEKVVMYTRNNDVNVNYDINIGIIFINVVVCTRVNIGKQLQEYRQ